MTYLNMAFVLFSLLFIATMELVTGYLGVLLKVIPVLLLMLLVFQSLEGRWRLGMLIALGFSAGGDTLLGLHGIHGGLFVAGLGSFLVAQVIYAGLFWMERSSDTGRVKYALAYFPVAALLAMVIVPASGELMAPVFLYLLAISVMVMGAAVCNRPLSLLFTGACLFALSDSLIAVNKFLFTLPMSGVWIMVTYYAAQYLIVRGVISSATRQ
ncbi:MAG: lysoplasmalogenase [Endozoicomonas sp.]